MFKKLFFIAILAIVFASCNNTSNTGQGDAKATEEPTVITVEEFLETPDGFVGKEIRIEGTVVHICQHGGKKMFIVGDDSDERVKITAGDELAAFKPELEGSDVVVTGVVEEKKIDEAYLNDWENELKTAEGESEMKMHKGGGEGKGEHEMEKEEELEQIKSLREQLKESGKDHLSFYSVTASGYKEKK